MNVLFVAAEVSPLSKVGGLADVAGSLTVALRALGHDVRIVTPYYRTIDSKKFRISDVIGSVDFQIGQKMVRAKFRETRVKNVVPVYLVEIPEYFGRAKVYGEEDDLYRFLALSKAAVMLPKTIGWSPDVLHAHDWHAAISIPLMKVSQQEDTSWHKSGTLLTIHNLQYQGHLTADFINSGTLDRGAMGFDRLANMDIYPSMLGLGLATTDIINTVSPNYAQEVLTPQFGYELDPLLRSREQDFSGVLNGIDYQEFDPSTDPYLAANFKRGSIESKHQNKSILQQKMGLASDARAPLFGCVSRFAEQKGIDILADAIPQILSETTAQFAILGTGDPSLEATMRQIAEFHPGRVAVKIGFDIGLGQLIYGGSDVFVMPSRFEPCGLSQMIALRYGTVPLVRSTGGLADTVEDCGPDLSTGNGFVFKPASSYALANAAIRAAADFSNTSAWRLLQDRGMGQDFSWDASALQYLTLYKRAQDKRLTIATIPGA